jgi:RNA-directed DNA polymerase
LRSGFEQNLWLLSFKILILRSLYIICFNFPVEISFEDILQAYYTCRKNTNSALLFEVEYEKNLYELWQEINSEKYKIGKSITFVVKNPVKREIFAAEFRDRIVHHLIINKLNPLFEKTFIYDSYACRVGRGTHFGIKRADKFIRKCSKNYTQDCYILKLDIQGFFMHINRKILFEKLEKFVVKNYFYSDKKILLDLCRQVIFYEPTKNCIFKGKPSDWEDLPKSKSLFHSPLGCGIPIGNLTSQIFANFFMNSFDHYIKKELGIKYYGRYVDDFFLVHNDREYLKSLVFEISSFLQKNLELTLHPRKIYLQHYSKGLKFLGAFLDVNRIYIGRRTKGNFFYAIQEQNRNFVSSDNFLSCMNSYLGMMKHYKTFSLRKNMIEKNLNPCLLTHFAFEDRFEKFVLKS